MPKNSIYLSGWEYNRILADDPMAPRQSALPAEVLWNGSAQFWLFEHVYCTKESLVGELAAAEVLRWSTGSIFGELKTKGFLETLDWSTLPTQEPEVAEQLRKKHRKHREMGTDSKLLTLLQTADETELESIKVDLLEPLLSRYQCVNSTSINSVRQWANQAQPPTSPSATSLALGDLAAAVNSPFARSPSLRICRRPGSGVSEESLAAQRRVETTVQAPMIPHLLAGILSQAEYMEAQKDYIQVFEPVNKQLLFDWRSNVGDLERVRDLAKMHLWPDLHGDWLPHLEADPTFLPEFRQLLFDAILRARLERWLTMWTAMCFAVAVYYAPILSSVAAPAAYLLNERRKETEKLTLFLQKAVI